MNIIIIYFDIHDSNITRNNMSKYGYTKYDLTQFNFKLDLGEISESQRVSINKIFACGISNASGTISKIFTTYQLQ